MNSVTIVLGNMTDRLTDQQTDKKKDMLCLWCLCVFSFMCVCVCQMCQIGFSASFSFHKRRHRYEEQVRGGIKMRITPRHLSNLSSKFTVHISHNHASRLTLFWHSQFTTTTTTTTTTHFQISQFTQPRLVAAISIILHYSQIVIRFF